MDFAGQAIGTASELKEGEGSCGFAEVKICPGVI